MKNGPYSMPAHVKNQCMNCNAILRALHHACKHPADTQKGVADLWLYQY